MNANPTAWYNREVAMPFAQDFRNLQAKFRPQQTTGNQVLDSVLAMTNQPKPQTFSQSIATRPLMGENPINISPQHAQAKAREALDNQYNQMLMSKLPQQDPYYLSPNRPQPNTARPMMPQQPINNPNLANPNMKAGSLNLRAMPFFDWVNTRIPLKNTNKALQKGYANFSYEAIPSSHLDPKQYPLESEIYKNLRNNSGLSAKYENEIYRTNLFKDTAHKLGLKFKDMGQKAGYYTDNINGELQSVSNPSRQVQILAEFDKNGNLTKEFIDKMNYASAVIGKNFKQDSVGWHIPNTKAMPNEANGISINLGKSVNAYELKKLDEVLNPVIDGTKINKYGFVPDPDGQSVRIIDYDTYGKDFTNMSDEIKKPLKQAGYNTDTAIPFGTKNELIDGKDWKYDTYGYERKIGENARRVFGNGNTMGDSGLARFFSGEQRARDAEARLGEAYQQRLLEATKNAERKSNATSYGKSQSNAGLEANANGLNKQGFITPNLASHIATSGTGALIGALQDSENRLRGATIGAIGGIGANKFIKLGANAFIKNQTDNIAKELPNLAKGKALNGDAIDDIVNKRTTQTPQSIQNRPLMDEMAERNAHLNQIREIFDKQNAKVNLGKDYHSDINAVEQGLITPDEFINAWKKPSVADNTAKIADDIPHNGGGNGGDIPPNTPKGGGFADDGGNEFAKQIGLENLSDNDLKKAFADMPKGN